MYGIYILSLADPDMLIFCIAWKNMNYDYGMVCREQGFPVFIPWPIPSLLNADAGIGLDSLVEMFQGFVL
jgi:hypothetical protein